MTKHTSNRKFARVALALIGLATIALGISTAQGDDEILIWTDSARLPGYQLYQKTHPDVKVRIVTIDFNDFKNRINLFNKAGSGWPDVVFTPGPADVTILSQPEVNYTADLTPLISSDVIGKFAKNSLDGCRTGKKLYCLRNDLAQVVLWYNAKTMKDFGYNVPKTWEEYEALGLKVAKEHPGYVVGAAGDNGMAEMYFHGGACPITQKVGSSGNTVRVNFNDPKCVRVAKMLDNLLAAGAVTKAGPFEADFVKLGTENKILMLPAANWFGEFVFKPTYKTPSGQLSAAMPLRWANQKVATTFGWGGGAYFVSTHAKNPKAAADVITWMATSPDYQADAPTFPAYLPAADVWAKKIREDKYYASDIYPVFREAASMIVNNFTRYNVPNVFGKFYIPAVKEGKSIVAALPDLQTELVNAAKVAGYTVITK